MFHSARSCPGVFIFALTLLSSAPAMAKENASPDQEIKPIKEWAGSVEDESLLKEGPAQGFITDEKAFKNVWQEWKLGDKIPAVDFAKELVLVDTTSGSRLNVSVRLTEEGNLKVLGIATRDFLPGFRYRVLLVSREGVKMVNGKELLKN